MRIQVLILCLIIGVTAGIGTSAADGLLAPGFGETGIAPGASGLVADQMPRADKTRSLNQPKPLETVLKTIKEDLPGRALGARLVDRQGRQAYEIRWMGDNGKVSDITADAVSGEIVDKR
jgi:hypothetical protein